MIMEYRLLSFQQVHYHLLITRLGLQSSWAGLTLLQDRMCFSNVLTCRCYSRKSMEDLNLVQSLLLDFLFPESRSMSQ